MSMRMINVPLIPDTLAVRGVIYNESRGGYINNIPGTFTRRANRPRHRTTHYSSGVRAAEQRRDQQQQSVAASDQSGHLQGHRACGLCTRSTTTGTRCSRSRTRTWTRTACSAEEPSQLRLACRCPTCRCSCTTLRTTRTDSRTRPDHQRPHRRRSRPSTRAATSSATSTRCRTTRTTRAAPTPTTTSASPGTLAQRPRLRPRTAISPSATWHDIERNSHQSHELRLSTPDDWRVRGTRRPVLGRLHYSNRPTGSTRLRLITSADCTAAGYFTRTARCCSPATTREACQHCRRGVRNGPATSNNPDVRNINDTFFDDITRGYKQKAAFGSVDFDIIPKKLTLTVGTRYYRIENSERGSRRRKLRLQDFG